MRSDSLRGRDTPLKVYEYLAAGLPVVATGLREDTLERRRTRSAAARGRSYEAGLDEIAAALTR